MNKRFLGLFLALALIAGSIYYLEGLKVRPVAQELPMPTGPVLSEPDGTGDGGGEPIIDPLIAEKLEKYEVAPELAGISGYINADEGLKLSDLRGKVVLVDFWTYSCINCIRTFPYLKQWHEKYADKGLVIVGVHTPEFNFEKKYENVVMAADKYGLEYPIVQDNDYATWSAFENRYWPRKYLVDKDGFIRYDHIGEGAYAETEKVIQELLSEIGMDVSGTGVVEEEGPALQLGRTPELYAGHKFALARGQNVGNLERLQPGKLVDYALPEVLRADTIYLEGPWRSNEDNLAAEGGGKVFLRFSASSVNIVAEADEVLEIEVLVDGEPVPVWLDGGDVMRDGERAYVTIVEPRLYNLVSGDYGKHLLELRVPEGFRFNSFTFG